MARKHQENSSSGSPEMLGKKKLIAEIEKDARTEAEQIIERAEKTKSQKIAAAEGKAKRILQEAEERADKKIEHIKEQSESTIQIQKKRIRLQQAEDIIRYIFDRVEETIEKKVGSPEYVETLKDWAVEGVLGVGADALVIATSEREKPLLTKRFIDEIVRRIRELEGKEVSVEVSEKPETDYGICVRSSDGRLEYRNQISTRLARKRNEYKKMIYAKLEIEGTS